MILFVHRINPNYQKLTKAKKGSGLSNCIDLIIDGLKAFAPAHSIHTDGRVTDIHEAISKYNPSVIIFEAIWMHPIKIRELKRLYPGKIFVVHVHSHIPFLACESNVMGELNCLAAEKIPVIVNSEKAYNALKTTYRNVVYLPNIYLREYLEPKPIKHDLIDIGCHGSIRLLKNHLLQAMAAIRFAKKLKKQVRFHINSTRIDCGGANPLGNLIDLFSTHDDCFLEPNQWFEPDDFVEHVSNLSVGMQVSLSESFNIVAADYTAAGIPIVVSKEVEWATLNCVAKDNCIESMVDRLEYVIENREGIVGANRLKLKDFSLDARDRWIQWLSSI